jgi:gametolysin peptidase M11
MTVAAAVKHVQTESVRFRRSALLAACLAAGLAGGARADLPVDPRSLEAAGDMRVLVIRATWGPTPTGTGTFAGAADFYRRASFDRFRLHIEMTPWLRAYTASLCPDAATPGSAFGAVGDRAQSAARAAGYNLAAYGRLVYVVPEKRCFAGGVGLGREVFLAQPGGALDYLGLVHELGHTFGLPHATSSKCARGCALVEYGDPLSPMGHGATDFSALEKLKLGWISSVRRVDAAGTYNVADIDKPSTSPQALVVPTAAGEYWIEHRDGEVIARVVKPNAPKNPVFLRSIFLARTPGRYAAKGVFSVTPQFQFRWLDRKRPTIPRARALDNTVLSWSRSSDAGSGIAGYRITVDGRFYATTTRLLATLPLLPDGGHRLTVVAVDRAGNRSRPAVVNLQV